jgi:uncharacterized protein
MKYLLGKSLLLILLPVILFAGSIIGQDVIPRPEGKQQLVYDYAGFLDKSQDQELNQMLEEFALETSNQILFLTVKTLNGLEPYAYAEQVLSTWGIGQKDLNNGIVFLVKPKTQDSRGKVFISVAYGLEGAIPDATANLIINNEVIPAFKNGNNYQGVYSGVIVLMDLAKGEINAGEYQKRSSGKKESRFLPFLFFIIIFIIIFGSKASKARKYASTNNMAFWAAFWLLSNSNRSHGGSWNSFHGGSGGFGGGGGGGFGGFGGGFGGGGGAGGSW